MNRRWVRILLLANLIALVALAFIYPHLMVSPGPLIAAHSRLTTDCFACHSPGRGADSQRCVKCHAPAEIGLRKNLKTSFHQELIEQDCMACHSDHPGTNLTERRHKPFSHALLRPAIRQRCESCHAKPDDSLHRQIEGNCAQCHRPPAWKPATFDHSRLFELDRDHDTECATCHTKSDFSRYTCYGCHEHQPAQVRAEHLEEGIRDIESCAKCHRSAGEESEEHGSRERRKRD